jgi:hypothetical protein
MIVFERTDIAGFDCSIRDLYDKKNVILIKLRDQLICNLEYTELPVDNTKLWFLPKHLTLVFHIGGNKK